MTFDRADAVFEFLEAALLQFKPKNTAEKLVHVLMWKVRKKMRDKLESCKDTRKCNVALNAELALAFQEFFTKYCALECPIYPQITINTHLQVIDKQYG
jgi:hypothetical protein